MSNFLLSILQTTSPAVSLEFLIARCSWRFAPQFSGSVSLFSQAAKFGRPISSLKGWPGLSLNGKEIEFWPKKGPGSLEHLQETFRKSTRWIRRISEESAVANLHAQIPMPTFSWQLLQCNHWTAQKLNQCQSVQLDHAAQNDQKWRLTRNVQKTGDVMHLKFVANH